MDFSAASSEICFFPALFFPNRFRSSPPMRRAVLLITLLVATLAWAGFLVIAIRLMG